MSGSKPSNIHMRRYVRLGFQISLAPSVLWQFPLTESIRRARHRVEPGFGATRPEGQAGRSADIWVMAIIPIYEAAALADAALQNVIEFWEGEIVEIGSIDERNTTSTAKRVENRGTRGVMTVIRDRALIAEQHLIKVKADGFEMNGGVRLALKPADGGREVKLAVSVGDRVLAEQRVSKTGPEDFEMRDASDLLTGTIRKSSTRGLPLTDSRGRTIRRLSAKNQIDSFRRWGGGESSIRSFASYGSGPEDAEVERSHSSVRAHWNLERTQGS